MRVGEVNFGGVWLSSSRSIDLSRLEVDNVLEVLAVVFRYVGHAETIERVGLWVNLLFRKCWWP